MTDMLILNGNLYAGPGCVPVKRDMAVTNGKITALDKNLSAMAAGKTIDAAGALIVPPFMDTHMHIDKALTMHDDDTPSLIAACDNSDKSSQLYYGWPDERIYNDIMERASRIVEMCVANGTQLLRTNLLFTPTWRTLALQAMNDLKVKYRGRCVIQNCVAFGEPWREELLTAAKAGQVDVVGGYPHLSPDYRADVDDAFALAEKFGLPVDLHCDESDTDNLDCFRYIIQKTEETHMQGRVSCGHVTGLNATGMSEKTAADAIAAAARAEVNVTSLTSCNMYLMNMTRRGPTRVRQLTEAGVNLAVASDNVRDTFRPFGNCDLLEEALLTAQVHKLSTASWQAETLDMVTWHAARTALASGYGLAVGCNADMVILEAATPQQALLEQAAKQYVIGNGKIIAESGTLV